MPPVRTAAILAVGSELLTPHRLDTNSLFLTARLNDIGIDVVSKSVIGDNETALANTELLARTAAQSGINGVPFTVLIGKYGLSGAQPQEVFDAALAQVLAEAEAA